MQEDIEDALMALMAYQQADEEGVMVLVSRQAIHEVHDAYRRLSRGTSNMTERTPGPWEVSEARSVEGEYLVVGGEGHGFGLIASCPEKADAEFIARLSEQSAEWKVRHDEVLQKHIECCGTNHERALAAEARLAEARDDLALADKMISEHIEEFHDFDYEPHQVPPELAQLRAIEHHLMGSLILDSDVVGDTLK